MKQFLYFFYKKLPLNIKQGLQKLIPFVIKQSFNVVSGTINYNTGNSNVDFKFYAPVRMFLKAKKTGIENTIIRNINNFVSGKSNGVILDVGLNYGFLSLVWSKANSGLEVIGFEANVNILKRVEMSIIESKINNLILKNNFVSDTDGGQVGVENLLNTGVYLEEDSIGEQNIDTVSTISLDNFVLREIPKKKILAIKIDTDGSDYKVLRGCQKVIDEFSPYIAVELNGDMKILEFLKMKGYSIFDMNGDHVDVCSELDLNSDSLCNVFASKS